jgi:hypothetical protein
MKAVWFTDGWARSYQGRAKSYGHVKPEDEERRMKRALFRMYRSQEREDAQRIEAGKKQIWV